MQKPKTIQIDFDLFQDLVVYAIRHGDADDAQFTRIEYGVRKKLDAMLRHDLYSMYQSGASESVRSSARKKYLDAIGLFDDFQWPDGQDANVTRREPRGENNLK